MSDPFLVDLSDREIIAYQGELLNKWQRLARALEALDNAWRNKERGFSINFHPLEVEREQAENAISDRGEL